MLGEILLLVLHLSPLIFYMFPFIRFYPLCLEFFHNLGINFQSILEYKPTLLLYKEMIEGFFHLCEHYIRDNMKLGVLIRHLLERHKLVENTQEIVSNKIVTLLWLRFH